MPEKSNKQRGMKPITKNVIVVDEQGNEYKATYLKRAKGLVKHGRARFISENKICLACPPNINLEDEIVDKNININIDHAKLEEQIKRSLEKDLQGNTDGDIRSRISDITFENAASENTASENLSDAPELTMAYVLARIDKIVNDTAHIHEAINAAASIEITKPTEGMINYKGDIAGSSKAEAISDVVKAREKTNRRLLLLLEKMYDDLKPNRNGHANFRNFGGQQKMPEDIQKFQHLTKALEGYPPEIAADIISDAAKAMFSKF